MISKPHQVLLSVLLRATRAAERMSSFARIEDAESDRVRPCARRSCSLSNSGLQSPFPSRLGEETP